MSGTAIEDGGWSPHPQDYRLGTYWLTASSIAAHIDAGNAKLVALPLQWWKEERVFALPIRGHTRFPRYALDANRRWHPLPEISNVIYILGPQYSGWALAGWFARPNPWLDERSPRTLLGRNGKRSRLLDAAWRERDAITIRE